MEAGEWWLDLNTGLLGRVGSPAIYNAKTCQSLVSENNRPRPTEGHCTFFSGGSICSGPGWRTVNCQSALNWAPRSACKRDPFERRVLAVALAPSELAGVAETARARAGT